MSAAAVAQAVERSPREGAQVSEMQRRRVLLAFCEVVGEGGLEAAVVGRICEQAGVSRRTFYELFADREACLLAAFDAHVESLVRIVAPVYRLSTHGATRHGWREGVRGALLALLEQFDTDPDLARLCIVEAPRAGPALLERRRRLLEALAAVVDEGRAEARAGADPPPLTAQGVVGGALSVLHARLIERPPANEKGRLVELTGPLMAMIVHPYLGPSAARRELTRPTPTVVRGPLRGGADPFRGLPIRFTYRTARVLSTIATEGERGAYPSNRLIAEGAGIADEGQMSRLLRRLQACGLVENRGRGHAKGEPNAWSLTERGAAIHAAIATHEQ